MLGREAGRVEGIVKNVRVFIAADPAQRVDLKRAFHHVGIKSGEFKAADIERNPDFSQLLLQYRRQQTRCFLRSGLHRKMKTSAVFSTLVSSSVKQSVGSVRIAGVMHHVTAVSPVLRR